MVGNAMLISGALKCLACCRAVMAMDKGCCPSGLRDGNVLVVVLSGRLRVTYWLLTKEERRK